MTDINLLLLAYAIGKYTKEELTTILEEIGFSPAIVNIYIMKADYKKSQVDQINASPPSVLCDAGTEG